MKLHPEDEDRGAESGGLHRDWQASQEQLSDLKPTHRSEVTPTLRAQVVSKKSAKLGKILGLFEAYCSCKASVNTEFFLYRWSLFLRHDNIMREKWYNIYIQRVSMQSWEGGDGNKTRHFILDFSAVIQRNVESWLNRLTARGAWRKLISVSNFCKYSTWKQNLPNSSTCF